MPGPPPTGGGGGYQGGPPRGEGRGDDGRRGLWFLVLATVVLLIIALNLAFAVYDTIVVVRWVAAVLGVVAALALVALVVWLLDWAGLIPKGFGGWSAPPPTTTADPAASGRRVAGWVNSLLSLRVFILLILIVISVLITRYAGAVTLTTEAARGLITVLVAGGTFIIALLLVLSTLMETAGRDEEALARLKERFALGKEILTLLIGIFGTILGFYFGTKESERARPQAVTTVELLGGVVKDRTVYLDGSNVQDADLALFNTFPNVERIYLDNTKITDAGLRSLFGLKDLKFLSVTGTGVSSKELARLREVIGKGLTIVADPQNAPDSDPKAPGDGGSKPAATPTIIPPRDAKPVVQAAAGPQPPAPQ